MKSLHCIYSKKRFADQYTLDLEGFMSPHEFTATINTFNTAAWHYPPPASFTNQTIVIFYLICTCLVVLTAVAIGIHFTHQIGLILLLPFSFLSLSMLIIYYRRRQRSKFESAMIHLCSCMNATENVRGINFRLTYLSPEQQQITNYPTGSTYAITIEFDDRYNLLHHFSGINSTRPPSYCHTIPSSSPPNYSSSAQLTVPDNTYCPNEKNVACHDC